MNLSFSNIFAQLIVVDVTDHVLQHFSAPLSHITIILLYFTFFIFQIQWAYGHTYNGYLCSSLSPVAIVTAFHIHTIWLVETSIIVFLAFIYICQEQDNMQIYKFINFCVHLVLMEFWYNIHIFAFIYMISNGILTEKLINSLKFWALWHSLI